MAAIDRGRPPAKVPHDGEATADAVLHLASLRVDAPLLARERRGENLEIDKKKLIA